MTADSMRGHVAHRSWTRALVRLLGCLLMLGALVLFTGLHVRRYVVDTRGIENGLAEALPPLEQPRLGINVSLERYGDDRALVEALSNIRGLGYGTVRQRFSWAEIEPAQGDYRWQRWDHVLPLVSSQGLKMIAVLDTSPAWTRPPGEGGNPWTLPASAEQYARFAQAFAQRYAAYVIAYQIWDEPNVAPHGGQGEINPAAYVELLRRATPGIRGADPDAVIVAGGLAPNIEPGGHNMSDVSFLQEIYRRGAGAYFDVLGVKAYGFWSGPDDRRTDPEVLNFSRVVLLREEMLCRGEARKPIWALDGGWCALRSDWAGRPSPQGSDSPFVQGERLDRALMRVQQEWPWMGLVCLQQYQPLAEPDDPIWGYALLGPRGEPQSLAERVRLQLSQPAMLYPGLTRDLSRTFTLSAQFSMVPLRVWGTDFSIYVQQGVTSGQLLVDVDQDLVTTSVDLAATEPRVATVRVGHDLPEGPHTLVVRGDAAQMSMLQGVRVGDKPDRGTLWASLFAGMLAFAWYTVMAWGAARRIPWAMGWMWIRQRWHGRPAWLQWAGLGLPFLGILTLPPMFRLGAVALYSLGALLRPDVALIVVLVSVPFAPLTIRLGPGVFSVTEITVLIAAAARLWDALLVRADAATAGRRRPFLARWTLLDWGVLALLLLGLATSFMAEYQRVAWRELRTIVAEPALFYLLLRSYPAERRSLARWVDALWLAGVAVALYALLRYPTAGGVIAAEGVRRARAFYGSPNNLALVLVRILPLGIAVAVWGMSRWRRWVYGLGSVVIGLALFLTFSRGAWLLGVPAAILVLAMLRGGRAFWLGMALAGAALLALIPLAGSERIASLLNLAQGTTFLRLSLWQAAWDMVRDHPLLGVGLDNFLYYYGDYIRSGAQVDRWLSHPHNFVLDFWLRLGVGGVVVIWGLLLGYARRVLAAYHALPEGDLRAITLGFAAAMAGAMAHGLVDASYFVAELAFWFMFALAWVGALHAQTEIK